MTTLVATIATLAGVALLFYFMARSRVKFEPWPRKGTRFRILVPLDVSVARDWPMDGTESTLDAGAELVVRHARPEGATAVVCDLAPGAATPFSGRPPPRDPYYLVVDAEKLRACARET